MKSPSNSIDGPRPNFTSEPRSSIFEKKPTPSLKVIEEVYSNCKFTFFDHISPKKLTQSIPKPRPLSLTPIHSHYRTPSNTHSKKEDVFTNPAAIYLSKKPIAYSKHSREAHRLKSLVSPHQNLKILHKKSNSNQTASNYSLTKDSGLVPIKEIQEVSPREHRSQSQAAKEIHCEALSQIANYCKDTLKVKTPLIRLQQKVAEKYSKEMDWVTEAFQNFSQYRPRVLKELFRFSSDSRKDLEGEREKVVQQMKVGDFDPNKNAIRFRVRKKRGVVIDFKK